LQADRVHGEGGCGGIDPNSIRAESGGNSLRQGIMGLVKQILPPAIFPRNGPTSRVGGQIEEINKMISALHDKRRVFFMDIGPKFLAPGGSIPQDVMSDGLHPASKGCEIRAEAVHDTLINLMQ
jgi:lysophospholipase L1-like esterase